MIRAVIDTNVLVSALLSPSGAPAKVFDYILNGHVVMCYDANIISEYAEVLSRPKFGFSPSVLHQVLEFITRSGVSVVPTPLGIEFVDEDDRIFYEVAVHVKGRLVTGNARHYPREPIVVSAVEFLKVLESQP